MSIRNRAGLRASLWRPTALAVALGMSFSGAVLAQSTTGNIFGQASAGETVVVKNASGVERSVTVGTNGRYAVNGLPVGVYSVSLQKDGQEVGSRSDVTIRVGAGTEVSFASATSAQNLQGLTVTANALPAIDVTSVDSRTVVTSQQLKTLPLARTAEAIALLAPGAVQGSSFFTGPNGNPLVSFGGSSVVENAYYINGMNVTDPLNGLGGITLPYGSIEQEEILTGGYSAAYGRSDGGVINQVGKRGTNEWHFGGQLLWTPVSTQADPNNIHLPNTDTIYQNNRGNKAWTTVADAYIGGPLIKDKLFLFASVEAQKQSGTSVSANTVPVTDKSYTYHDPKWYAKIDWNINDNNILELTGASTKHQYDGQIFDYDYDTGTRGDYEGADTASKTSATMWIAKYTGYITDNLTVTAQYGKQKTNLFSALPDNLDTSIIPIMGLGTTGGLQDPNVPGGQGPWNNNQPSGTFTDPTHQTRGANYRIDVSYVLGNHTITAGIDNQRTQDLNDGAYIPAGYNWEYAQVTGGQPITAVGSNVLVASPSNPNGYYVDQYRYLTAATVRVEQRAQYVEDKWQVNDRWLLSLGLRNDQFTNYNSNNDPYIREKKPQWAPRLGFSWDVNGDSSFRVYGNAGRYYLALPTSVALRGAQSALYTRTYYNYTGIDANGYPTGLTPIDTVNGPGVPFSSDGEYGVPKDPKAVAAKNLRAQYQDEYILGFDKQINSAWVYGAKATYRSLKTAIDDTCNLGTWQDAVSAAGLSIDPDTASGAWVAQQCHFFNPGEAATYAVPDNNGGHKDVHINNAEFGFQQAKRSYYALNLYLNHPFDGTWWGRIDYTFSRSYGNTEGQVKSDIGQSDIAATQDWDYPSLMQFANGVMHNDHTHQFKVYGGYQITPEWNVSGSLSLVSGAPYDCLSYYGPAGTGGGPDGAYAGPYYHWCNGKPSPSGAAGRLPWQKILSANLEYRPDFADHKLAFNVDIFNLLNSQEPTYIYEYNFNTNYKRVRGYTTPRYVRFGVTYDF
jgi:hypothetical protein